MSALGKELRNTTAYFKGKKGKCFLITHFNCYSVYIGHFFQSVEKYQK